MICPKCQNDGVRNEVLGKEFYYCRTCKDEIRLTETTKDDDLVHFGELGRYTMGMSAAGQWIYYCGYCNQRDGTKHAPTCTRPKTATKRAAFETGLNSWNVKPITMPWGSGK